MNTQRSKTLSRILIIAVAMCFIGHGSFGIITKPVWCNYFGVVGIGPALSYKLMPVVGMMDILLGLSMLVYPTRAVTAWLVLWGMATAMMRPLSGEPVAEFLERAGNFGAPLALLIITGFPSKLKDWFLRIRIDEKTDPAAMLKFSVCLRGAALLLLIGHGWLNISGKEALLNQYSAIGFTEPLHTANLLGVFEVMLAGMIFIRPLGPVVFIALVWKITSELFYPHYMLFEWVERGGSYGVLMALWWVSEKRLPVAGKAARLVYK